MKEYKFLLLEDSKTDAEFIQHYIEKDKIECVLMRVEREDTFHRALREFQPDLVLSDYNLPSYDGLKALKYMKENYPETPVVIVSGAIGEEKAVELLHLGAKDYVLKDKLKRLPNAIRRVLGEMEEIRGRKDAERKLVQNEARYRLLVENSPMCIHEIDLEGKIISMNRAGLDMLSLKEEKEVQGIKYLDLIDNSDREHVDKLMDDAFKGITSHFEFKSGGKDLAYFKSCFVPLWNHHGKVEKLMGITEDITERKIRELALKESESHFRQLADYDSLTKLPNRRLLLDRLKQAMKSASRSGKFGVLMFIDLDNFKPLNDNHGHSAGDVLLMEVARRITSCVRESDTVSRYGGDEFIVLLSDLDIESTKSLKKAGTVAEKIRLRLADPYIIELHPNTAESSTIVHELTASIGITIFGKNEKNPDDILKWADHAMYRAKTEGRNRIRFYNREYING
jgi:diguanylate cyclase (GGDEF)-like protein/PAS domain S-box-containing protein